MKSLIFIAAFLTVTVSNAQNNIENVLSDIVKNNKSIISNQQFWEAKNLLYKTGLTPENPKFEYENLRGNNGNQVDYYIVQYFDFPTAYIKKNQVANRQVSQSKFKEDAFRQDILLKAKQYCLTLIFLNKKKTALENRAKNASNINAAYQQKIAIGDANILDVNKAKLQLLNAENTMRINQSEIDLYNQKLTELNGGVSVLLRNNTYPLTPILPAYETLETAIEEADPNLKSIHQQNEIDQKKLELSKAMSLPKFEGGFRSQEFAGQKIQGVHLGITIPLWENKNKVKHQKAHLKFNDLQILEHHNKHHNEIKQLYQKYTRLSVEIGAYKKVMSTFNNNQLLNKALNLGEISSLQYFMELNYYYASYNTFLDLENEYYQVIAKLNKYKL